MKTLKNLLLSFFLFSFLIASPISLANEKNPAVNVTANAAVTANYAITAGSADTVMFASWSASTLYNSGSIIDVNKSLFICLTQHTSTSNSNAFYEDYVDNAYWAVIGDAPGTIKQFSSDTIPWGYLLLDGREMGSPLSGAAVSGNQYRVLYEILQDTYGGTYNWNNNNKIKLPDFRGIFPRGAGTSNVLVNANGVSFNATLGTYQNDKVQGHYHSNNASSPIYAGGNNIALGAGFQIQVGALSVLGATTDGTNGTPRTGNETNPANLGVNYIIKY